MTRIRARAFRLLNVLSPWWFTLFRMRPILFILTLTYTVTNPLFILSAHHDTCRSVLNHGIALVNRVLQFPYRYGGVGCYVSFFVHAYQLRIACLLLLINIPSQKLWSYIFINTNVDGIFNIL